MRTFERSVAICFNIYSLQTTSKYFCLDFFIIIIVLVEDNAKVGSYW